MRSSALKCSSKSLSQQSRTANSGEANGGQLGEERWWRRLDRHAKALTRNGEEVGVVEDVRLEPGSDQLEGFDVRLGGPLRTLFPGGDVIHLGVELVDSVEPERVRLRVAKEALDTKHG